MPEMIEVFIPAIPEVDHKKFDDLDEAIRMRGKRTQDIHENTLVVCTSQVATGSGCGQFFRIKDAEVIRKTYWDGIEDWKTENERSIICPKCGHRNRDYATPALRDIPSSAFREYRKV